MTQPLSFVMYRLKSARSVTRNMSMQQRAGGFLRLQNKQYMKGYRWTYGAIKPHSSRAFDRKVDRNADTLQRTIADAGEQDFALAATGRTATNSHGQSMPYPPFGIPNNL